MAIQPLSDFANNVEEIIGKYIQVAPNPSRLGYPSWPVKIVRVSGRVMYSEHDEGYDIDSGLQVVGHSKFYFKAICVGLVD